MFPSTPSPPEPAWTFNAPGHAEVVLSRCTPVPGLARRHLLESRHVLSDARSETFLKQAAAETAPHQLTV
jgi:hypothetical protein